MATSLTRVKGEVKANTIFDLTFDARQKCRKSNFSSREMYMYVDGCGYRDNDNDDNNDVNNDNHDNYDYYDNNHDNDTMHIV